MRIYFCEREGAGSAGVVAGVLTAPLVCSESEAGRVANWPKRKYRFQQKY